MVRDPARAPSGPPPSQGGQPDRQKRHRTHGTGVGGVRPTPSTVSGGCPPTGHPRGSSGKGVGTKGAGSSGGKTARVTTGAASTVGSSINPIDVSHMFEPGSNVAAFTREQMQEWMERFFTVKLQQFATEMGLGSTPSASGGAASIEQEDTTRRR
ncbi:hypothetical protein R1sor_024335 [Riccia sorocarpa]|uniref:Uncharacterized protein n=1 Tax=Riccia sorocarpa TaxID=122646 RepID=A0ABD3GWA4_9MARC